MPAKRIATDELDYDPVDKKMYVTDVGDRIIGSVDAVRNTLIKTFEEVPDSSTEQPRYKPADGMIYVALRATNKLAQFDPRTDTLMALTDIGVSWDLNTNSLDHTVANVTGVDGAIYNARVDRFFAAASRWHTGPAR